MFQNMNRDFVAVSSTRHVGKLEYVPVALRKTMPKQQMKGAKSMKEEVLPIYNRTKEGSKN
jgi:hypothetical protein